MHSLRNHNSLLNKSREHPTLFAQALIEILSGCLSVALIISISACANEGLATFDAVELVELATCCRESLSGAMLCKYKHTDKGGEEHVC